jgi:hypothetical protein
MSENSVAKFLADAAKDITPELAEDYYKYAKSLLSPDLPPVVVIDHINILTPERYEQNDSNQSKEHPRIQL